MENIMYVFVSLLTIGAMAQSKTVKGIVSQDGVPLDDVMITVSDSETEMKSSKEGIYEIEANVGDRITYSAPNLKTLEIIVEDVTNTLNIEMVPALSDQDQQFALEQNRTGRVVDVDLDKKDKFVTTVTRAYTNRDNERFNFLAITDQNIVRDNIQTSHFIIDGIDANNVTPFLAPGGNIERMSPISNVGIALFDNYGGVGASSLFGSVDKGKRASNLDNSSYNKAALGFHTSIDKTSSYLRQLKQTTSLVEAKAVYVSNSNLISNSHHFVLDAMRYFIEEHSAFDYAQTILQDGYMAFETNPVALKSLAGIPL